MNKYSGTYEDEFLSVKDLTCLTAALQMLISVPKVKKMFSHHQYLAGNPGITRISGEISRYINGKSASVRDLLVLLRVYSTDAAMTSAHLPSLEIMFFRVLHECVTRELEKADDHVRRLWERFTAPQSEGTRNFLELCGCEDQKKSLAKILDAEIMDNEISEMLPEYLFIRIYHPTVGYSYPDQEMILSNGKIYQLHCIVDRDSSTGRYRTSVLKNKCWRIIDDMNEEPASKEEVRTRGNYLYLYLRVYECPVDGCPVQEKLDKASLDIHHQTEHPTCSRCQKTFLLRCLYKEHRDSCKREA